MSHDPVIGLVARTFLWLAPCFAAWWLGTPVLARVVSPVAQAYVAVAAPELLSGVEYSGADAIFVTPLTIASATGERGIVLVDVSSPTYSFGLALFAALMLASRAPARRLLAGAIALLPFQAWGVAFDFLSQLTLRLGHDVAAQAGFAAWQREWIALGYQAGSLILPTLAPVLMWAAFNRRFFLDAHARAAAA